MNQITRPDIYGARFYAERNKVPETLAPGVVGFMIPWGGAVYLPMIAATNPGHGDVGRFLDSQPSGTTWKVPCVINSQLRAMLERRGFHETTEWIEETGEITDVWVRSLPVVGEEP